MSKKKYNSLKQFSDDFFDSGSDRPDKKNSIQEYSIKDGKIMCEIPRKHIQPEGEREGKNKSTDDRFES